MAPDARPRPGPGAEPGLAAGAGPSPTAGGAAGPRTQRDETVYAHRKIDSARSFLTPKAGRSSAEARRPAVGADA
ncbi:hypothetical protein EVAR_14076_1 [Eumeta japonica]|uniref:Uncharacterized protein n=1 Tax=Eumeta variegata TaxID=151549 RepID=A0A4C1UPA4_EUMVA|nr:hypothetical protein EVAR_14076_1 [Eumeta japonica]